MRFVAACLLASTTLILASGVNADPTPKPEAPRAANSQRDVATLLFGNPQWGKAPAGTKLTYAYSKKTTKPEFGPSFDDKIVLTLEAGDAADQRTADVKMFSGVHAKPAGPFRSDGQNPVVLLVLEENVQEMSHLFKANPRYLKNAIRKAWRDNAKIVDTQVDVGGKQVQGTRITVTPFAGDSEADKMQGLDGMTYTVDIADSVPGNIVAVDIRAPANGTPIFSETLHYEGDSK